MFEVLLSIYELTGSVNNRSYKLSHTAVRAWVVPASNEAIAMYDNVPQGQAYQFRILDEDIDSLAEQAKLVIAEPQGTGFDQDDTLITIASAKKAIIAGRRYLTGMCYLS